MNNKFIKISGAIGITKLKRDDKIITIFADNHEKNNYCSNNYNDDFNIRKFLNKKKYNSQILLEEVERKKGIQLKELWSSNHTQDLKDLYLEDKYNLIIPIDIRNNLFLFSWEIIKKSDNELSKTLMISYLKNFDDFFEIKKAILPNLSKILDKIIFKKSGILKHFLDIRKKYRKLKKKFNLTETVKENLDKNINNFHKLNNIASMIMEFYMMALVLSTEKESIIHAGLWHTSNFIDNIKKYYKFKEFYKNGKTKLGELSKKNACVIYEK